MQQNKNIHKHQQVILFFFINIKCVHFCRWAKYGTFTEFSYMPQCFNPYQAGEGQIRPQKIKIAISLEPNVESTSNQAVNLSLSVV